MWGEIEIAHLFAHSNGNQTVFAILFSHLLWFNFYKNWVLILLFDICTILYKSLFKAPSNQYFNKVSFYKYSYNVQNIRIVIKRTHVLVIYSFVVHNLLLYCTILYSSSFTAWHTGARVATASDRRQVRVATRPERSAQSALARREHAIFRLRPHAWHPVQPARLPFAHDNWCSKIHLIAFMRFNWLL